MRARPTAWLASVMSGLISKPDPEPPSSGTLLGLPIVVSADMPLDEIRLRKLRKLKHVQCVDAEYQAHLAYWRTHWEGMPPQEYVNVLRALNVWHERRLQIAREMDAQEAAKATA